MKVSLNTILGLNRRYGCADDITRIGIDQLIEKIGAQLGALEEAIEFGKKYEGIVIAKVVSCEKHPNADKLRVCLIDDGGNTPDVKRGDDGYVQVVCGAHNVRAGLSVAWLPPGSTVPAAAGGQEPFVLEARELRGVLSNGMLASPKELGLGDDHDGILEIDGDHAPGTSFAEAFGLKDDIILDIENKMFTHRPDCFGFLGVARELAGIQGLPFKSPDWYVPKPVFPAIATETLSLSVENELPSLVPRFTAITMADVKVGPSPVWLQVELAKAGQKSINNIVDYGNFFMTETAQPIHIYDYDKVAALSGGADVTMIVRNPKPGEKIKLLNGQEIEPRPEAMMVATDKQLICLGGAMGGVDTEVDENTKNIIIEAASWDMFNIRRTAMEYGIFTDAVTRFTKGQSPLQNLAVLNKIVNEIIKSGNGEVASRAIDDNHLEESVMRRNSPHPPITVTTDFINSRLGLKLSADEMKGLLQNVECQVEANDDSLTVTAPFWRTDIELREDVVEEIGRLYGYDKLPLEMPGRDLTPAAKDPLLTLKASLRVALSAAGANEVLTYSFVHGNLLEKAGQDLAQAFQISNALSPGLQYYRLSLVPSLLEKVHPNAKAGYGEFALFELGKAHVQSESDPFEPEIPKEVNSLALVFAAESKAAKSKYGGAPFYQARAYLMGLLAGLHALDFVKLEPLRGADLYDNPWIEQMVAPFEPSRAAVLRDHKGLIWGVVGEFKNSVGKALKLPEFTAGFELDPLLFLQSPGSANYVSLPRFPKVTQDITLKVSAALGYQELFDFVWAELAKVRPDDALPSLDPVDIYQAGGDSQHKNVTLRLNIASYGRTLTDAEVNQLLDTITAAAKDKFSAERI